MKKTVTPCPVEEAMLVLGGRWRAVLIYYLLEGPKRFSELRKHVPNISQRMLTLDLRTLEDAGLITRTVYAEVPPRVEYELTAEGQSLRCVIEELRKWGVRLRRLRREGVRTENSILGMKNPFSDDEVPISSSN